MPLLNEYLKLRTEQLRELSWAELDDNFLYVANPWSPERIYKEGNIVYYGDNTDGLSWWRATVDHGPDPSFNIGNWEPIGATSIGSGSVVVESGAVSGVASVLDFDPASFDVTFAGSTAQITVNAGAIQYWLEQGSSGIGSGQNDEPVIHTGDVVIGSGSFPSAYTLAVYGTTNITGNLTVGGTINGINLSSLSTQFNDHKHTAINWESTGLYPSNYPNSINSLEDFDIDLSSLTGGETIAWNNSTQKWEATLSSIGTLAGLSDVNIFGALNNQVLRYNSSLGQWQNVTVSTDPSTGFSTVPFVHNHDSRYYTQTQLNTGGGGGSVHWNNLTNKPVDNTYYLVSAVPSSPPFTMPNYRVITSSDSSITIDTSTANIIDITTTGGLGNIDVQVNTSSIDQTATIDFVDSDYVEWSGSIVGSTVQIEATALHGYQSISPYATVESTRSITRFINQDDPWTNDLNVTFTVTDNNVDDVTEVEAQSRLPIIHDDGVSPVTYDPRLYLKFIDSASIAATVTDDPGGDAIEVQLDIVGATSTIDVSLNSGGATSVDTIDFVDTSCITWSISSGYSPGTIEVSASCSGANLQTVTDNGNTTTNTIEITTFADIATEAGGIILASPLGNRFLITVDDDGNLITSAL
jgi:hypothetical protein